MATKKKALKRSPKRSLKADPSFIDHLYNLDDI